MVNLESVIEAIQCSEDLDEAFSHLNQVLQKYGYNNACYTLMTDHPSIDQKAFHGLATSYPEDWLNYYNEKEYQENDAVWIRLLDNTTPFFWQDAMKTREKDQTIDPNSLLLSKKIMNEAEEASMADGIGISFINQAGEISGIGISKERSETSNNITDLAELFLIGTVFHDKYMSSFTEVSLPKFTSREKDVLSWSVEGKTDWEIAKIIGISYPTVRFHWNNIFKKMQVNNKILATSIAIRRKIIFPQRLGIP